MSRDAKGCPELENFASDFLLLCLGLDLVATLSCFCFLLLPRPEGGNLDRFILKFEFEVSLGGNNFNHFPCAFFGLNSRQGQALMNANTITPRGNPRATSMTAGRIGK